MLMMICYTTSKATRPHLVHCLSKACRVRTPANKQRTSGCCHLHSFPAHIYGQQGLYVCPSTWLKSKLTEAAWQWLAADEVLPLGRGLMRLMPGKPGLALRLLLLQVLLLLSWFHVDVALSGEARW